MKHRDVPHDEGVEHAPPHICNHRWEASRIEAETLPVTHVCVRTEYNKEIHTGVHLCSCGATTDYGGRS